MPDDRHNESLSGEPGESEIERDLARLLSIAPSADFGAQVRRRIQDERPHRAAASTLWVGLASAAAVVLIAIAAARSWQADKTPQETLAASDVVLPAVPATPEVRPVPPPAETGNRRATPPRAIPVIARKDAGPAEPEVIVSRDQLRAIARYQQMIVRGELTGQNLPPAGGATAAVTDIRVPALIIAPLTVPAVDTIGGGRSER